LTRRFIVSFLIEFSPMILFFIGSESYHGLRGFFLGTQLLVAATPIVLVISYVRERRFALFPFMVGVFVLLLGGATLLFHDPRWIQLEYTLYNGLLGCFLLVCLVFGKLPLKRMFDSMIAVTDRGWQILSLRYGVFLIVLAFLNQIILHFRIIELWVYYRFLSFVVGNAFGVFQVFLLKAHRLPEANSWGLRK